MAHLTTLPSPSSLQAAGNSGADYLGLMSGH